MSFSEVVERLDALGIGVADPFTMATHTPDATFPPGKYKFISTIQPLGCSVTVTLCSSDEAQEFVTDLERSGLWLLIGWPTK
jgi:hypothetical protein